MAFVPGSKRKFDSLERYQATYKRSLGPGRYILGPSSSRVAPQVDTTLADVITDTGFFANCSLCFSGSVLQKMHFMLLL